MKLIVCMTITSDEGGNNASLCSIHSKLVLFVNWSSKLVLFVNWSSKLVLFVNWSFVKHME